jgi:hypothetical protein
LTWTSAPASFNVNFVAVPQPGGACGGLQPNVYPTSVVQSIALPNGKSYQFQYDGTYGLLSKITYPSGAYISYTWGVNPLSETSTFPNAPGQSSTTCTIDYDLPAITHRYVSFDGVNIALQQDFCYSTDWGGGTASCGPAPGTSGSVWASKQTTVTTKDCARNNFNCSTAPSFTTTYSYRGVYVSAPPNVNGYGTSGTGCGRKNSHI